MKRKTVKLCALALLCLLTALLFVSCTKDLTGSWEGRFEDANVVLTLSEDGTGNLSEKDGRSYALTYIVNDGDDILTLTLNGQSRDYTFSLDDDTLTLRFGSETFTLKKSGS